MECLQPDAGNTRDAISMFRDGLASEVRGFADDLRPAGANFLALLWCLTTTFELASPARESLYDILFTTDRGFFFDSSALSPQILSL
jgi:hypothetical protein